MIIAKTDHWQRGINVASLLLTLAGVLLFSQVDGFRSTWVFVSFVAGLMAIGTWLRYARPHLWRQAAILLVLLTYVFAVPIIATGRWRDLVFVAGLLLPVTIVAALLYFGARSREH